MSKYILLNTRKFATYIARFDSDVGRMSIYTAKKQNDHSKFHTHFQNLWVCRYALYGCSGSAPVLNRFRNTGDQQDFNYPFNPTVIICKSLI